ncbi:hypothetical protein WSK_3046 [Novosphingobium sp. Rr 2-17]|nr:hypothetical protein WSK_3046 [Novosphingobium sp. Rr 2-17]
MDHLGFVEAVDRLCQSVVIAVTDAADGRLDARFSEALGVLDRYVLRSKVAMVNEPAWVNGATLMASLLQGIQNEVGVCGPADPPVHDIAGVGID